MKYEIGNVKDNKDGTYFICTSIVYVIAFTYFRIKNNLP